MHQVAALLLLSISTLVLAQDNPLVLVGTTQDAPGGVYQFIPSSLNNIASGTTITFRFTGAPGNHSVTQSTFSSPCEPLAGGFDSGWVFIPQGNVSISPEWNLTVTNDTTPLWFFCKQLLPLPHCTAGMVGAINAPQSGNTFEAFQSNAKSFNGSSGQGEGALVGVGASASVGPGPQVSGAQFFTGVPVSSATATAPGSASASATGTAAPGSSNGALGMQANSIVVMMGVILGICLCFV